MDDVLREAGADDVPMLARNRLRMFEDMWVLRGQSVDPDDARRIETQSVEIFAAQLGREQFGWVVEHDGAVVASAMVHLQPWLPVPDLPDGRRPYYHSVYTDHAHRGRGHAERMTRAALDWTRARGYPMLVLHASEQGRPIYERLGFEQRNEWALRFD